MYNTGMISFDKFVKAVSYMRECQKDTKKQFSDAGKKKLAEAEAIVDNALKNYKLEQQQKLKEQQNELFQ